MACGREKNTTALRASLFACFLARGLMKCAFFGIHSQSVHGHGVGANVIHKEVMGLPECGVAWSGMHARVKLWSVWWWGTDGSFSLNKGRSFVFSGSCEPTVRSSIVRSF